MRIFHTSDWHLGKTLGDWDRTEDFTFFLDWLIAKIEERRPDILLVAGDVFDVSMPPISAQRLYYGFLQRAAQTSLSAVVVTAGNHDSQAFLSASSELLQSVRTIVAGADPESQSIIVRDREGAPLAAIAAVPYLKDGEVRKGVVDGDALDEFQAYEAGIEVRYREAHEALLAEMAKEGVSNVPKIVMGHLFLRDAIPREKRAEVLAMPEIGSIRMTDLSKLGDDWDYAALGHIHRAGPVEGDVPARYCGAPIALHFTHKDYRHQVVEVTFDVDGLEEVIHDVPQHRAVRRLSGRAAELPAALEEMAREYPGGYVGLELTDEQPTRDMLEPLTEAAQALGLRLVNITVASARTRSVETEPSLTLDMLSPDKVFDEVLRTSGRSGEEADRLRALFARVWREAEAPAEE